MTFQTELNKSLQLHAERIAINYAGKEISYSSLRKDAHKITHHLLGQQIESETIVGIDIQDKGNLISTIIGVINARCVFVLLDRSLPSARLHAISKDLDLQYVISSDSNTLFRNEQTQVYLYKEIVSKSDENILLDYPKFEGQDSLYIYFTSGSTGTPKGIIGKNISLLQFLQWEIETFDLKNNKRVSQLISPYFDAFLRDVFAPLLAGGTICIPPDEEDFFTPEKIIPWLDQAEVNLIHCVPSLFRVINDASLTAEHFKQLKYVLMSGEKIIPASLKGWYEVFGDRINLVNLYGLTETTMIRSFYIISPNDVNKAKIPIGSPIHGTELLIAKKDFKPCNTLIPGDLYIISEYVSKGYLNNPELTQEKFLKIPGYPSPNAIAVKTGDKARRLPNKTIELIGREDRQVKLRGIRIELDEIESRLAQSGLLQNQVVIVQEDSTGNDLLLAFIIAKKESEVKNATELKEQVANYLRENLPTYMIPSDLVVLDEFPLLSNGKLDYKGLVKCIPTEREVIAPTNELEEGILGIWKEILGDKSISTEDRFHEIGGNSLTIMNLIGKINKVYGVRISLSQLFKNPTIKLQASFVGESRKDEQDFIPKYPQKPDYVLTSAQKRLHFLHTFDTDSLAYNLPQICKLEGDLDQEKLRVIFNKLIDRHESLRIYFEEVEDVPRQKVAASIDFNLAYYESNESEVKTVIDQFIRPFNLKEAPLFRVGLIHLAPKEHILVIDSHHIISDGMSERILIRDFIKLYKGETLEELQIQYTDYAQWQNEESQQTVIANQKDFWLSQFSKTPEPLQLPTDFVRPAVKAYEGEILKLELEEKQTSRLKELAAQEETTLFMLLLAAFNVLISKISAQEDLVVGTPIAGRRNTELENMVGLFANTIPLRNRPQSNLSFKNFLAQVKENTLACFDNQDYPYEALVDALSIERDTSRNPLFDIMFAYQNFEDTVWEIDDLKLSSFELEQGVSKLDLSIFIHNIGDKIKLNFEYSSHLFKPDTIRRFMTYYQKIVNTILENVEISLAEIDIIPAEEKTFLLHEFNKTDLKIAENQTIPELFETVLKGNESQNAVIFEGKLLSYEELNARSNQLARKIQALGIGQKELIGVCLNRSEELIISLLGVLKAGCAYVPIDPEYPEERIKHIIEDSKLRLMITESGLDNMEAHISEEVSILNINTEDLTTFSPENLNLRIPATQAAYVIYTSGSTGKPKGVIISHKNVHNFVCGISERIPMNTCQRILGLTTVSFDIFVLETWFPLLKGMTIVLASAANQKDSASLASLVQEQAVDIIQITPSHLKSLLGSGNSRVLLSTPKIFLVGGEAFPAPLLSELQGNFGGKIYNMYGPTESTVWSTVQDLSSASEPNIGHPIANTYIRILNEQEQLQPIGVVGELCIGGLGVGQGYWNRPELSADKFIPDPINQEEVIYKTGDMARWLADGSIDFRGRVDNQVKIRGFRIELGEIEAQLSACPGIKESAVVAREKEGEKYLVAFYESPEEIPLSQLKESLLNVLPGYMVPAHFKRLSSLPLTPNGKLDRKALPDFEIEKGENFQAPSNPLEKKLVEIWAEVLAIKSDEISINKSFFELGGHSLNAMKLANRIFEVLGAKAPLSKIFLYQDIQSFSKYLITLKRTGFGSIDQADKKAHYALTPAQRRLYFLHGFENDSLAYNGPHFYKLEGKVDKNRLQAALNDLLLRHEILRTSFELLEGEPRQKVLPAIDFQIEHFNSKKEGVDHIITQFIRPFDLAQAPLIRVGLIQLSLSEHILLLDIHHIISDGMSEGILFRDFMELYKGNTLEPLPIQYKDFAEWQSSETQQALITKQKDFWLEEFSEIPEPLLLPLDSTRPKRKGNGGDILGLSLSEQETQRLKVLAKEEGATLYMVLLAIFNVLLSRLSGQRDIVVGTPISSRGHSDLDQLIGLFANTIPIRNYPEGNQSFNDFLKQVKKTTISSFDNQDYPYEALVNALSIERDTSRNPLFDVMFDYHNFEETSWTIPELSLLPFNHGQRASKFDLTLEVVESSGQVYLNFEYDTDLFHKNTIERISSYFKRISEEVLENSGVKLSSINLLSSEEEHQLLYSFNDTKVELPHSASYSELWRQAVENHRQNIAVEHNGTSLSYQDLYDRSSQLAAYLQTKGVGKGSRVVLYMPRSIESLSSMLAVFRLGAAYIPIDVYNPIRRVKEILVDSESGVVLSTYALASELDKIQHELAKPVSIISVDQIDSPANNKLPLTEVEYHPEDLAYIIYTSGSTGKPKGVMIHQQGMINHLYAKIHDLKIDEQDVIAQTASPGFDISVWQFLAALLRGGKTYIIDKEDVLNPEALLDQLKTGAVSIFESVPSLMGVFIERIQKNKSNPLKNLKWMLATGEPLSINLSKKWYACFPNIPLINAYGPTEASDDVTHHIVEFPRDEQLIPVGKPIQNIHIYVLDEYNNLCPIGVKGQICVSGIGVGLGYWKNNEKTEAAFVANPFADKYEDVSYQKLYKTGDSGYLLSDGTLICEGRIDEQVKILGNRIELGEIEERLLQHPAIKEVAVLAKSEEESTYLASYYVADEVLDVKDLRKYLLKQLPDYMVPHYYMLMDRMPTTASGKLNKKALPAPEIMDTRVYVAPTNKTETKLVEIWAEVLNLEKEKISITSNFFELGGHSLSAMKLEHRIAEELKAKISLRSIFEQNDIKSLSELICDAQHVEYTAIEKAETKESYPLSRAQQGMYFLHQFDPLSLSRNLINVLKVEGPLDKTKIQVAVSKLIDRHEGLRTSYHLVEGEIVQQIAEFVELDFTYFDGNGLNTQSIIEQFIRPFDLEQAPLLRVGIIGLSPESHILMIDLHHLVADGLSINLLIQDFISLYKEEDLAPVSFQYRDFVEWQKGKAYQQKIATQKNYWQEIFKEEIKPLEVPVDIGAQSENEPQGASLKFSLSVAETKKLNKKAEEQGVTPSILLLSYYTILLAKLSKQEDIVLGFPVSGREQKELEGIVGMFAKMLPIRTAPQGSLTFKEYLLEVKSTFLAALDNQSYPYEALAQELQILDPTRRNPWFDISFLYQHISTVELSLPGLSFQSYEGGQPYMAPPNLNLIATEEKDSLLLTFNYSQSLFDEDTVRKFSNYFKRIFTRFSENIDLRLSDLELVEAEERKQLLFEFNETEKELNKQKNYTALFEEQVKQTPERIAVEHNGTSLTYEELFAKSRKLSAYLQSKGVEQGTRIGIYMPRSIDMLVSILGTLDAGAAYVPLDIFYPASRIEEILSDSELSIILTTEESYQMISAWTGSLPDALSLIQVDAQEWEHHSYEKKDKKSNPDDLAYIIYTSGTTGKPKGVMIHQLGMINHLYAKINDLDLTSEDVIAQTASPCFDISVWQYLVALIIGAKTQIIDRENVLDPESLYHELVSTSVSVFESVPSLMNTFLDELSIGDNRLSQKLRWMLSTGEPLNPGLVKKWYRKYPTVGLLNAYGPTEASDDITHYLVPDQESPYTGIPIGKPIQNMRIYILDNDLNMCPIGIRGEVCVSGIGVGKGYWKDEAKTQAAFVENPYKDALGLEGHDLLYKTGDIGYFREDGNIICLGRLDHQVKIRGNRIELGEIENRLEAFDPIQVAAVEVLGEDVDKYLVAYYVSDKELLTEQAQAFLAETLPEYMIPAVYMRLPQMPLTPNGKLDRKSLPTPDMISDTEYIEPSTDIEKDLVEIWAQALQLPYERISITANFFQIGGNSLSAVTVVNRIHQRFDVKISLKEFFSNPNIQSAASYLQTYLWLNETPSLDVANRKIRI